MKKKHFQLKKSWTTFLWQYINIFRHWGFHDCFSLTKSAMIVKDPEYFTGKVFWYLPFSYARAFVTLTWRLPHSRQYCSHPVTYTQSIRATTYLHHFKKRLEKYSKDKETFTKNWCYKIFFFSSFSRIYHLIALHLFTDFPSFMPQYLSIRTFLKLYDICIWRTVFKSLICSTELMNVLLIRQPLILDLNFLFRLIFVLNKLDVCIK